MEATGERVERPGIYSNDCHEKKVAVSRGEAFPRCPDCRRPANWRIIQVTA